MLVESKHWFNKMSLASYPAQTTQAVLKCCFRLVFSFVQQKKCPNLSHLSAHIECKHMIYWKKQLEIMIFSHVKSQKQKGFYCLILPYSHFSGRLYTLKPYFKPSYYISWSPLTAFNLERLEVGFSLFNGTMLMEWKQWCNKVNLASYCVHTTQTVLKCCSRLVFGLVQRKKCPKSSHLSAHIKCKKMIYWHKQLVLRNMIFLVQNDVPRAFSACEPGL